MITYAKVFEAYPDYRISGIESVWYPIQGWTPWMDIYALAVTGIPRDELLLKCFREGAERVQLVLQHTKSNRLIWSDYAKSELLTESSPQ